MPERKPGDEDRRRSARFSCSGQATICLLPSSGISIPGTIRDLSLHGCCVDMPQPMDCGVRAEVVVRVNASSFRAVGEVKALHGPSTAGMEFLHLSAGGKYLLTELVAELARLQALMNRIRSARLEVDAETFRKELEDGRLQAIMLSERFPILGTILTPESFEPELAELASNDRIVKPQPLVIPVDLFG